MGRINLPWVAAALLVPTGVHAQVTSVPEDRQAILEYKLSVPRADRLIGAMGDITRYLAAAPDSKERVAKLKGTRPAQRVALIESDATAMAILRRFALSATDYVVGIRALRMALIVATKGPRDGIVASPQNIEFAKAHAGELTPKLEAVDAIRPPK